MMESLKSITEIPDLRRRILFTLAMLAVYRLGAFIPTPGINADVFEQMFNQSMGGGLFGLLAMFSGGSLRRLTVFALGIMPYITASIILQLLGVVSPTLEKLRKEGELGRRKITEYTRWLTVGLAAFQGFGIAAALQKQGAAVGGHIPGLHSSSARSLRSPPAPSLSCGWESRSPRAASATEPRCSSLPESLWVCRGALLIFMRRSSSPASGAPSLPAPAGFMVAIVAFIVMVERGERRIPIQYAKRIVGRKVMGGVSTHLPLKVNSGGVMPIIFAVSILTFPQTVGLFLSKAGLIGSLINKFSKLFAWGEPLYTVSYVLMIMFFAHFYLSIVYNPDEVADNVRKQGGFIPASVPASAPPTIWTMFLPRSPGWAAYTWRSWP